MDNTARKNNPQVAVKVPGAPKGVTSTVQEYSFKDLLKQTGEEKNDTVSEYSFSQFTDAQFKSKQNMSKVIKLERDFAEKNRFQISEYVRDHRGIKEQEKQEYAKAIEDNVHKELDLLRDRAYQEGHAEGREVGRQEVLKESMMQEEVKLVQLQSMLQRVLETESDIVKKQKNDIVLLVNSLTKWVILRELKEDGAYVSRLLEKLVIELGTKANLTVRVSPDRLKDMPEVLEGLQKKMLELKNVKVEVDPEMALEGLTIESDNGIIHSDLKVQFETLDKVFEQSAE